MSRSLFFKYLSEIGLKPIIMKEIILTHAMLKPSSRISFDPKKLSEVLEFCEQFDIKIEQGDYKVIAVRDIGKGGWKNKVKKIVSNSSSTGLINYYISRNKKTAKHAKFLEQQSKDVAFGKKLGFPQCDQKFFLKNVKEADGKQGDFTLLILRNSKGDMPFNKYINTPSQYFGYSLLSHYPHSFECASSIKIAKQYYKTLSAYSKKFADLFLEKQTGVIIFTEYRGISRLSKFSLQDDNLKYKNTSIECTLNNSITAALVEGDNIKIISRNHFEIRKGRSILRTLQGENYGIMVFS